MESRPDLVLMGGEIFCAPTRVYDLQCVAQTARGKRCNNGVEPSQTASWTELKSKLGIITVYDVDAVWPRPDEATLRRWRAQHCHTHDDPDAVDFLPPAWEPFDPTGTHAALVKPLTDEWTR